VSTASAATLGVTIHANHAIAENGVPLLLSGIVSSGRRGEAVTIEQDDCGPIPWHPLRTVRTGEGGGWVSYAGGDESFRLRARGTRWETVATAKLDKHGSVGQYAQTWGMFTKKTGHGLYRAVLPATSAAPCYVAGFSGTLRV
jgi:hypothetical protein